MKSKRILVLCPYPEGVAPTQRFRYEQYAARLRERGYELTLSPFMPRPLWDVVYEPGHLAAKVLWSLVGYARRVLDLARLPLYDGAYVSLHVTPLGTSLFERLARLASKRLLYEIDDLVYLPRTSEANRLVRWLKGGAKARYLIRSADHVIAATPWLEELARRSTGRVTRISSTVRTDVLRPRARRPGEKLVLGWTGSHSTAPYLRLLDEVLARLRERHDFKLLVIGAPSYPVPGRDVERIAWRAETEVEDLARIDVGLYPLPDDPWVLGKTGLKAIQYMSMAIPCVASAAGTTPEVIEDGATGFLARTDDEWVERLERLILDPGLRRRMGERGRERAERLFSVEANAPRYLAAFTDAFGAPPGNLLARTVPEG